jgi:integrase
MSKVHPIRSQVKIEKMKELLREGSERNYMLFHMGINIGVRVGDLVKLKVRDVLGEHIDIVEEKRGKERVYLINNQLRKSINAYIATQHLEPDDYLFQSRKGENHPVSRVQAYRIFSDAAAVLGIERVGTHTLRKTYGYWHYKRFRDVAILQKTFGHSSPSETLIYIGIEQDEIDEAAKQFYI